jgi:dipeptidyl-peptidase-4
VKARDGFLLRVCYLPPDFDPARKYPVYQHLYAGPMAPQVNDRWSNDLYRISRPAGLHVWVLDNRSASNKGAASAWGIHRNLGAGELQDQLDGLEWLRAKAGRTWTRLP